MSKKILNGKVVRDQNDKTIVVLVKRKYIHPYFKKVITPTLDEIENHKNFLKKELKKNFY